MPSFHHWAYAQVTAGQNSSSALLVQPHKGVLSRRTAGAITDQRLGQARQTSQALTGHPKFYQIFRFACLPLHSLSSRIIRLSLGSKKYVGQRCACFARLICPRFSKLADKYPILHEGKIRSHLRTSCNSAGLSSSGTACDWASTSSESFPGNLSTVPNTISISSRDLPVVSFSRKKL